MWFGCSCDVREEVLPVFFLGYGAAEPLLEMRRAEARVIAGGKALIVQFCAEVGRVHVRGHLPWISRCAQETPGEFIHSDRFGTGHFDRTIHRLTDCDFSQSGGDIIRRDGLHESW